MNNVTSTTFSQQKLDDKLLLVLIWTHQYWHHFLPTYNNLTSKICYEFVANVTLIWKNNYYNCLEKKLIKDKITTPWLFHYRTYPYILNVDTLINLQVDLMLRSKSNSKENYFIRQFYKIFSRNMYRSYFLHFVKEIFYEI